MPGESRNTSSSSGLVFQENYNIFVGLSFGLTPAYFSPRSARGLCFQCCSLSSKSLGQNLFNFPASEGRVVWASRVISQVVLLYPRRQPLLQEHGALSLERDLDNLCKTGLSQFLTHFHFKRMISGKIYTKCWSLA